MDTNTIQFTINAAAKDEIIRLRAVNAELLEALEFMVETHATPTENRTTYALTKPMAAAKAIAAIAKARG